MDGERSRAATAATDFVATSGLFGVAVVSAEGDVAELYGALVEHLGVGEPADEALPFLLGLEDEIEAVRRGEREHVHLPNVNLPLEDGRLLFTSVWVLPGTDAGSTTVILHDTTEASNLHRQMMQQRNDLDIARRELERANRELEQRGIELQAATRRAEEATEAKSRFLAMMTHEIRTPMNGVLGMLQLIEDGDLSDEKRRYAHTARTSAEALIQIIGDILDFSKIEAGRLDIERIPFDPTEVTQGVVQLLRPRAGEKGIGLECTVGEGVPRSVLGDPGRCRQILLNLIGNAVKFTEHGGVSVFLDQVDASADVLRFAIADTGIGISEEARGRLFTEFTQSDASTTRRYGGTGLGLAICKKLVELMSGAIGVDSVEGEGSTFWFELPLEATREAPVTVTEDELPTASVEGARILLADDALANREVAVAMLTKGGYEVDTAVDGREAVSMARGGDYDLILMDLNMPEMDGRTATSALRAAGETLPILAMTAHAEADLGEMPGFDGHVAKPVRRQDLLQAVAVALGADGADGASSDEAPGSRRLDMETLEGFLSDVGKEVFPRLIDTYLRETRRRLAGLAEELAAGNLDVVERYAHDIKSCAGTLGAWELHERAFTLERVAGGRDADATASGVPPVVEAGTVLDDIERLRDRLAAG